MADLITVDDPDDPRLRDYTGLTDVELRRRREPAEGLFIAEGEKVIRRARHAGYEMRSMLLSAKWVDLMRDVIDEVRPRSTRSARSSPNASPATTCIVARSPPCNANHCRRPTNC